MRNLLFLLLLTCTPVCFAQSAAEGTPPAAGATEGARAQEIHALRAELDRISARLDALEHAGTAEHGPAGVPPTASAAVPVQPASGAVASVPGQPPALMSSAASSGSPVSPAPSAPVSAASTSALAQASSSPLSVIPTNLPGGATLNYAFDGYYEYNANHPPGRVNDLRAYDVLSNAISINQADVIFALDPDLAKGRRYGVRVDLQFGQATDTLQGNPANEPRPGIYQNIFQAYGTYVVPVGSGLNLDFGKWASSLGIEGNYTKDQQNYSRSFYFYFLPFYHEGVRASYHLNDKLAVNYWLVNGTNQSEPTNGYKDELFGFVVTPNKRISWTSNYYLGQEHADNVQATGCQVPEQPGLCVAQINPAPNGKLHIFDNYVSVQATSRLSFIGEADYFLERQWAHAAPGESSAPSHVIGGAGYAQYQLTPRASLAARSEYLSDRGGLFSNRTQALKEVTGTYKFNLGEGFDTFVEFRRDWSNQNYFTTQNAGAPSSNQTTATVGLVWWYGGKQGSW